MAVQGGFGVALKIDITAVLTLVTKVLDTEFPNLKKFIAESTAHDSAGGYYEATATGKYRAMPFPATIQWDAAEATHAEFITAFAANASKPMSIEDPAGTEVISFNAHIEEMGRAAVQEGLYQMRVLIHPTGQATIT